jgi:hypothetical protein
MDSRPDSLQVLTDWNIEGRTCVWVSGFQLQGYVQSNFKKMLVVTIQGGERNKELLRQKRT